MNDREENVNVASVYRDLQINTQETAGKCINYVIALNEVFS